MAKKYHKPKPITTDNEAAMRMGRYDKDPVSHPSARAFGMMRAIQMVGKKRKKK
jgi:hypothetical protein